MVNIYISHTWKKMKWVVEKGKYSDKNKVEWVSLHMCDLQPFSLADVMPMGGSYTYYDTYECTNKGLWYHNYSYVIPILKK